MNRHSPAATRHAACTITEQWVGRTVVISVSGVLDMLTAPQLEADIDSVLTKSPAAVIVDLTDVEFLASAGMGVLAAARERADGAVKFAVVADGPATSRPLTLIGLADHLGLHPTVAAAQLGRVS